MVVLTLAELVVGLFTGRLGEAWASLRALVGLVPRTPTLLARRGTVSKVRQVTDNEILRLQNRGSARLTSYLRARDTETYVGVERNVRRWRPRSLGPAIAWIVVLVGVLAASRTMFDTRVPSIGEFLPLPDSPRGLWSDFTTAWNPAGLGSTSANPTGWAAVTLASPLWLARSGLGLTVIVVGLVLLGIAGVWRLATVFPTNRSRVAALAVYAAVPLAPGVISTGRLTALVAYAAVPWFVHLLRGAVGIGTADPASPGDDMVDGVFELSTRERARRTAVLAVVTAVAVAMAPAVLPVVALVAVLLAVATLVSASWRTAAWMGGLGLTVCAGAFVLNLPWSLTWSWDDLVAPTLAGAPGRGLVDVASMAIGQARLEVLALALYVPVLIALADRPRLAVHVGCARRLPRRRVRCAGCSAGSRRPAVAGARRRSPARARGAGDGAGGGGRSRLARARRGRSDVRLATARRRARARRGRGRRFPPPCSPSPMAPGSPPATPSSTRPRPSCRATPRSVTTESSTWAIRVCFRRRSMTWATAWRWRWSTTGTSTSVIGGRPRLRKPTPRSSGRSNRSAPRPRCAAAGSWPRSASASSSCRSSTEPTRPPPTRCRYRPACSTRSVRSSTSRRATARPVLPCSRTGPRSRRPPASKESWPRPPESTPPTTRRRRHVRGRAGDGRRR